MVVDPSCAGHHRGEEIRGSDEVDVLKARLLLLPLDFKGND